MLRLLLGLTSGGHAMLHSLCDTGIVTIQAFATLLAGTDVRRRSFGSLTQGCKTSTISGRGDLNLRLGATVSDLFSTSANFRLFCIAKHLDIDKIHGVRSLRSAYIYSQLT